MYISHSYREMLKVKFEIYFERKIHYAQVEKPATAANVSYDFNYDDCGIAGNISVVIHTRRNYNQGDISHF